jgi:hypothetical protein
MSCRPREKLSGQWSQFPQRARVSRDDVLEEGILCDATLLRFIPYNPDCSSLKAGFTTRTDGLHEAVASHSGQRVRYGERTSCGCHRCARGTHPVAGPKSMPWSSQTVIASKSPHEPPGIAGARSPGVQTPCRLPGFAAPSLRYLGTMDYEGGTGHDLGHQASGTVEGRPGDG